MAKPIFIETDERKEAMKALEFVTFALRLSSEDVYCWKWVIIAVHNAMQAFIVCAISGTAGLGAIKEHIVAKWLKVLDSGSGSYPDLSLGWFPELYARMKKEFNFVPLPNVDESVDRLNKFRNGFIHFTPKAWLLEALRAFQNVIDTPQQIT